jgi:hypothetical protein
MQKLESTFNATYVNLTYSFYNINNTAFLNIFFNVNYDLRSENLMVMAGTFSTLYLNNVFVFFLSLDPSVPQDIEKQQVRDFFFE